MEINRKHFPRVMQDNDETFLAHLEGVISSVDELCSLEITKNLDSYKFRIATSLPKYNNMVIEEILKFCNMFHIRLDMSKSIKTTSVISFEINLDL
jgi:DNA-binding phage protein